MAKNKDYFENHAKPVTRRDFLARGVLGFSATAMIPAAMGLFSGRRAVADGSCSSSAGPALGLIPFLVFDMAGGGALPGNFLVGKQGGPEDLLESYNRLGWDPRAANALDKSFGLPMAANISKILEGIKTTSSPEARACLRMGSLCHISRDDTTGNPLSAVTLVSKAGYTGTLNASGVGMVNSASGGNSDPALIDAAFKPLVVSQATDVAAASGYGGPLQGLQGATRRELASAILKMSLEQKVKLHNYRLGDQLADLAGCGYKSSLNNVSNAGGLDPRKDPLFQKVYGITEATAATDQNAVFASVTQSALMAYTGPGVMTVGGCDYHDGTQASGDAKDLEMGQAIGRAIEASYRLGKPVFFQLLTDGGVFAVEGTRNWGGDSGDKSMTVVGYMNPKAAPEMRRLQVGYYSSGQGAETSTLLGAEPAKASYAVFANYLNVCGKLADFEKWAPGVFQADQLDSVLLFA